MFLKLSSVLMSRALLPPLSQINHYMDGLDTAAAVKRPIISYARAINYGVAVRAEPNLDAKLLKVLMPDEVLPIYAEMETDSGNWHNKFWYEVEGGYVHSALIHPVEWKMNTPLTTAGTEGFWGEVTVPYTDSRSGPSNDSPRTKYRYYGGTVYKVINVVKSRDINSSDLWYQIDDESFPGQYYVNGKHLRVIPKEEFNPSSPDVSPADKKIVVNLREQRLHAFEKDVEVFSSRTATGAVFTDLGDKGNFATPTGNFSVFRKTPAQHMYGGRAGDSDYYDLPGIPWVSYFVGNGIAFHGTYWHNDYGVQRSHGCINVPSPNAHWIWRWTLPANDPVERYTMNYTPDAGTRIVVV